MAKFARKEVDLDIELTKNNGEVEIIKPVKAINAQVYKDYIAYVDNLDKKMEDVTDRKVAPDQSIDLVIEHIDFLYEKGNEFWIENTDMQTLIDIKDYIHVNFLKVKKN